MNRKAYAACNSAVFVKLKDFPRSQAVSGNSGKV